MVLSICYRGLNMPSTEVSNIRFLHRLMLRDGLVFLLFFLLATLYATRELCSILSHYWLPCPFVYFFFLFCIFFRWTRVLMWSTLKKKLRQRSKRWKKRLQEVPLMWSPCFWGMLLLWRTDLLLSRITWSIISIQFRWEEL